MSETHFFPMGINLCHSQKPQKKPDPTPQFYTVLGCQPGSKEGRMGYGFQSWT